MANNTTMYWISSIWKTCRRVSVFSIRQWNKQCRIRRLRLIGN